MLKAFKEVGLMRCNFVYYMYCNFIQINLLYANSHKETEDLCALDRLSAHPRFVQPTSADSSMRLTRTAYFFSPRTLPAERRARF